MKPLTDDEVPGWLDADERRLWRTCVAWQDVSGGDKRMVPVFRSLAETRRALDAHEVYPCKCCNGANPDPRENHAPDCIFSTLPRPGGGR